MEENKDSGDNQHRPSSSDSDASSPSGADSSPPTKVEDGRESDEHAHDHHGHHDHVHGDHHHHDHGDCEDEHHHHSHLHHHHQHSHHNTVDDGSGQHSDMPPHGSYPGLGGDQMPPGGVGPSSLAQAQVLQQQLQHHLQQQLQQSPFPFAYQAGLPMGVGMPAGMPAHMSPHLGGTVPNGNVPNGTPSGNGEDTQQIKPRPKRKQVKSACLNCRKRKTGCDSFRPCTKCVRNGLESTCVDVPRKKRSSNRAKTNTSSNNLSASSSSPSPTSSPAMGVSQSPNPTFASPLPSQIQYMSVNLPAPGMLSQNGGPLPPQPQYPPQLISMAWGPPNGAGPQLVPMTWEEITKHVASAQSGGMPGNLTLAALPPEIAWKGSEGGIMQPGTMTQVEQSK